MDPRIALTAMVLMLLRPRVPSLQKEKKIPRVHVEKYIFSPEARQLVEAKSPVTNPQVSFVDAISKKCVVLSVPDLLFSSKLTSSNLFSRELTFLYSSTFSSYVSEGRR